MAADAHLADLNAEQRLAVCHGVPPDGPLRPGPAPCPYALCTCSVPANRGMIAGIAGGVEEA